MPQTAPFGRSSDSTRGKEAVGEADFVSRGLRPQKLAVPERAAGSVPPRRASKDVSADAAKDSQHQSWCTKGAAGTLPVGRGRLHVDGRQTPSHIMTAPVHRAGGESAPLARESNRAPPALKQAMTKARAVRPASLAAPTLQITSMSTAPVPTFVAQPPKIEFFGFFPGKSYQATFTLQNLSKTMQRIRLLPLESRFFSFVSPPNALNAVRVAAGLSVEFKVQFTPEVEIADDAAPDQESAVGLPVAKSCGGGVAPFEYEVDIIALGEAERFVIPVRASRSRGELQLPGKVDVGECAVKEVRSATVLLRNDGDDEVLWRCWTTESDVFAVSPAAGAVAPHGGMMQMEVHFRPPELRAYAAELVFDLGNVDPQGAGVPAEEDGLVGTSVKRDHVCANTVGSAVDGVYVPRQSIPLYGTAVQVDVAIDASLVQFPDTFITLERQGVVTVVNNSAYTVHYTWRTDANEHAEHEKKMAIIDSLVPALAGLATQNTGCGGDLSVQRERHTLSTLSALAAANQIFDDVAFAIHPVEGVIYSKGRREFTVTFSPQLAVRYLSKAFLDIGGRQPRIPLQLEGSGIGPQCALEFKKLDVGDVFIKSQHKWEFRLENYGCIPARYTVVPSTTRIGSQFIFTPPTGLLEPGEITTLSMYLCSEVMGVIAETFHVHIHGSPDDLLLSLKGRIIGPTFHFDVPELDFGVVSYNLLHIQKLNLVNTSDVPIEYFVHIPEVGRRYVAKGRHDSQSPGKPRKDLQRVGTRMSISELRKPSGLQGHRNSIATEGQSYDDGGSIDYPILNPLEELGKVSCGGPSTEVSPASSGLSQQKNGGDEASNDENKCDAEFQVTPCRGTIAPHDKQLLEVEFLSNTVQEYNTQLIVDIAGVGENLDAIAIRATCLVADVTVLPRMMNFGECCYVGHPYVLNLGLHNSTVLTAKYAFHLTSTSGIASNRSLEGEAVDSADDDDDNSYMGTSAIEKGDYELCKSAPISVQIGDGTPGATRGIISCRSTVEVPITIVARECGDLTRVIYVSILGSSASPIAVTLCAKVRGPCASIGPKTLPFGTLTVLEETRKIITISNDSPIPAYFQAMLKSSKSGGQANSLAVQPFRLSEHSGMIPVNSSSVLKVFACLDDSLRFHDEVHIIVQHSEADRLIVPITAKGVGYPLVPSIPMKCVDFGDAFTATALQREFVLSNRGRRPLEVQWHNTRGTRPKEGEPPLIFQITPERLVIPAKGSASLMIKGISKEVGTFTERFILKHSEKFKEVWQTEVTGNFIIPSLQFSTRQVSFKFIHNPVAAAASAADTHHSLPVGDAASLERCDEAFSTRAVTIKNSSPKRLTIDLKVKSAHPRHPFSVEPSSFALESGESIVVAICFDGLYRGDCVSHELHARLLVKFVEHEHTESLKLSGTIVFPNLEIDRTVVDCGIVLRDTEQREKLVLKNISCVPVSFRWAFAATSDPDMPLIQQQQQLPHGTESSEIHPISSFAEAVSALPRGQHAKRISSASVRSVSPHFSAGESGSAMALRGSQLDSGSHSHRTSGRHLSRHESSSATTVANVNPISNVFDFVPFFGTIDPGQEYEVKVVFNGKDNVPRDVLALCQVDGGPTYPVRLLGKSGEVGFAFSKTEVDFAVQPYMQWATKYITVSNTAHVPVSFTVNLSTVSAPGRVEVKPLSGMIVGKEKLRIRFRPTVPDVVEEKFFIQVAHMDPQPIVVRGVGSYLSVAFTTVPTSTAGNGTAAAAEVPQILSRQDNGLFSRYEKELAELPREQLALRLHDYRQCVGGAPPVAVGHATGIDMITMEAERLCFRDAITADGLRPPVTSAGTALGDSQVGSAMTNGVKFSASAPRVSSAEDCQLAHYVIDMGSVIRGERRRRVVRLVNTCLSDVVASFNRKDLEKSPVHVTPEKIPRMRVGEHFQLELLLDTTLIDEPLSAPAAAPHPGFSGSAALATAPLKTQPPHGDAARQTQGHLGNHSFKLRVDIKGGPHVVVEVRCNVVIPELRLSESSLDFGETVVGQVRKMFVTLRNTQPIVCYWSLTYMNGPVPAQAVQSSAGDVSGRPVTSDDLGVSTDHSGGKEMVMASECSQLEEVLGEAEGGPALPSGGAEEQSRDTIDESLPPASVDPENLQLPKDTAMPEAAPPVVAVQGSSAAPVVTVGKQGLKVKGSAPGSAAVLNGRFICMKQRGMLQPNESEVLEFWFVPTAEGLTQGRFRFAARSNRKPWDLVCSGMGKSTPVSLTPPTVHMPPSLPCQILQHVFTIENNCEYPVEVYSMDFDEKYLIERQLLLTALTKIDNGMLLLPVREPGQGLPDVFLEKVYAALDMEEKELMAIDNYYARYATDDVLSVIATTTGAATTATTPQSGLDGAPGTRASHDVPTAGTSTTIAASVSGSVGRKIRSGPGVGVKTPKGHDGGESPKSATLGVTANAAGTSPTTVPVIVVILGPPLSGKTTQVNKLVEVVGLRLVDLQDAILSEAEHDTPEGEWIRTCLSHTETDAPPRDNAGRPDAPELPLEATTRSQGYKLTSMQLLTVLVNYLSQLSAPRQSSRRADSGCRSNLMRKATDAERAVRVPEPTGASGSQGKKGKGGKGTATGTAGAMAGASIAMLTGAGGSYRSREALLAAGGSVLSNFADQLCFGRGLVFDDLRCSLCNDGDVLLRTIGDLALLLGCRLAVVSLGISPLCSNLRRTTKEYDAAQRRMLETETFPLWEDDYARMSVEERGMHDVQLQMYYNCRKIYETTEKRLLQLRSAHSEQQQLPEVEDYAMAKDSNELSIARQVRGKGKKSAPLDTLSQTTASQQWTQQVLDFPEDACADAGEASWYRAMHRFIMSVDLKDLHHLINGDQQEDDVFTALVQKLAVNHFGPNDCTHEDNADDPYLTEILCELNRKVGQEVGGPSKNWETQQQSLTENMQLSTWQIFSEDMLNDLARSGVDSAKRKANMLLGGAQSPSKDDAGELRIVSRGGDEVGATTAGAVGRSPQLLTNLSECFRMLATTVREVAPPKKGHGKSSNMAAKTPQMVEELVEATRWIIAPHTSVKVTLEFCSKSNVAGDAVFRFGVVGCSAVLHFSAHVEAAFPDICRDPKVIFASIIQQQHQQAPPGKCNTASGKRGVRCKSWNPATKLLDFGPLLIPVFATDSGALAPPGSGATSGAPTAAPGGVGGTTAGAAKRDGKVRPALPYPALEVRRRSALPGEYWETLRFSNTNSLRAEVTFSFDGEKERVFSVSPQQVALEVGEWVDVFISAAPTAPGEFRSTLVATIHDNPTPWMLNVTCVGVQPQLSVNGRQEATTVDFSRCLLGQEQKRTLVVRNECQLPICWSLSGVEKAPPKITFSSTAGTLEVNGSQEVQVTFSSTRMCAHAFTVKLVSADPNGTVFGSLPVTIKAEAHDAILEWTKEVDFKAIRVGEMRKEVIRIMNKGPYEVGYMFRVPRFFRNALTLSTESGVLRGMLGYKEASIANIDAVLSCQEEIEISPRTIGEIEVSFFNPVTKELLYPTQSIRVSGTVCLNRFTVKPSLVNFGPCMFRQKKTTTFDIQNTGMFDFGFQLFNYATGPPLASNRDNTEESLLRTISRFSRRADKMDAGEVSVGVFSFNPGSGVVPAGAAVTITASIYPEEASRYHETLGIFVENSELTGDQRGVPLELLAEPCVPGIVADLSSEDNVDLIFEELQVVSKMEHQPNKRLAAYSREEQLMTFGSVLIGRSVDERIRLTNPSKVACTVQVRLFVKLESLCSQQEAPVFQLLQVSGGGGCVSGLAAENKPVSENALVGDEAGAKSMIGSTTVRGSGNTVDTKKKRQLHDGGALAAGGGPFSAAGGRAAGLQALGNTLTFDIPPFEKRYITLRFTPESLNTFSGMFEATVIGGHDPRTNLLHFGLHGEGVLPSVALELPPPSISRPPLSSSYFMGAWGPSMWTPPVMTPSPAPSHGSSAANLGVAKIGGPKGTATSRDKKLTSGSTTSIKASVVSLTSPTHALALRDEHISQPHTLLFPRTIVGTTTVRTVVVRNTGSLDATFRISSFSEEATVLPLPPAPAVPPQLSAVTLSPMPAAVASTDGSGSGLLLSPTEVGTGTGLPAKVTGCGQWAMASEFIEFPHENEWIVLGAGQRHSFDVAFHPTATCSLQRVMKLSVQDNHYEDMRIDIVAEGYEEVVSFVEVDDDCDARLTVGDCYIGKPKQKTFYIRSNTSTKLRYQWCAVLHGDVLLPLSSTAATEPIVDKALFTAASLGGTADDCDEIPIQSSVPAMMGRKKMSLRSPRSPGCGTAHVELPPINGGPTSTTGGSSPASGVAAAVPALTSRDGHRVGDLTSLPSPQSLPIRITPSMGHLAPGAVRPFTVTITSNAAVKDVCRLKLLIQAIADDPSGMPEAMGIAGAVSSAGCGPLGESGKGAVAAMSAGMGPKRGADWDDSMVTPKWVTADAGAPGDASTLSTSRLVADDYVTTGRSRRVLRKVFEAIPEPPFTVLPAEPISKDLFVPFACDYTSYQLSLPFEPVHSAPLSALHFPTTMMFQKRKVILRVTNTGRVELPFSIAILTALYEPAPQDGACPFAVEPENGVVPPRQFTDVTVIFTPLQVSVVHYFLALDLPHGQNSESEGRLQVPLHGTGLCPVVHFDIPSSTYLATRVEGELGGADAVNPQSYVVEFLSTGIRSKSIKSFKVINPTTQSYSYEWVSLSSPVAPATWAQPSSRFTAFRCTTPFGTLPRASSHEAVFEFTPDAFQTREAAWEFRITGQPPIPFVLVGKATEPRLFFDQNKVNFGNVIVGGAADAAIRLVNEEGVAYPFRFNADELGDSSVTVAPLKGFVPAHGTAVVQLRYTPVAEGVVNLKMVCHMKNKSAPLTINVKGEGYRMKDTLFVAVDAGGDGAEQLTTQVLPCGTDGVDVASPGSRKKHHHAKLSTSQHIQLTRTQKLLRDWHSQAASSHAHILNLGRVFVNDTVERRFLISNDGPLQLAYEWTLLVKRSNISIEPSSGIVAPHSKVTVMLTYSPTAEETMQKEKLQCIITNGGIYRFLLNAISIMPQLQMGFKAYDFGPRFVATAAGDPETKTVLTLMNRERVTLSVECNLVGTSSGAMDVSNAPFSLAPREVKDVVVAFTPKTPGIYKDVLNVVVNGVSTIPVALSGEGVVPKVDVLTGIARFGVVRVGETRSVVVMLECSSRIPTPVSLDATITPELAAMGFAISSHRQLLMKPRETKAVTITLRPTGRVAEFTHNLMMMVCGVWQPLVTLIGSCHGVEMQLDVRQLNFDRVVIGSTCTRRVILLNTGDFPQHFEWNQSQLNGSDVTVVPAAGTVRAHMEEVCEFTYAPTETSRRLNRTCEVRFDQAAPLTVNLIGRSSTLTTYTDTLNFSCAVRSTASSTVDIVNDSFDAWTVRPHFDNKSWSGSSDVLVIPPKETVSFQVTFAPTRFTPTGPRKSVDGQSPQPLAALLPAPPPPTSTPRSETSSLGTGTSRRSKNGSRILVPPPQPPPQPMGREEGVLTIPFPNGTMLSYKLIGSVSAPSASGPVIKRKLEARGVLTETLEIQNLAPTAQRFQVKAEWQVQALNNATAVADTMPLQAAPKASPLSVGLDEVTTVVGPDRIDIPAHSKKDYKFSFSSLVEKKVTGTITFINTHNGEYQFYVVEYEVISGQSVVTPIQLVAAARTAATYDYAITNPLGAPATIAAKVEGCTDLTVPPTVSIPARSTVAVPIRFFPIVHKEYSMAKVTMSSAELGIYVCNCTLTSKPAGTEPMQRVSCPLGQSATFTLRFQHFCKSPSEYAIKFSDPRSLSKAPGASASGSAAPAGSGPSSGNTTAVATANLITGGTPTSIKVAGSPESTGAEVRLDVVFEPAKIGSATALIELISPTAGTYVFPINTVCTPPKRHGPLVVLQSQPLLIPFKNVLGDQASFTLYAEPASMFSVVRSTETIASKKAAVLQVLFRPPQSQQATPPGGPVESQKGQRTQPSQQTAFEVRTAGASRSQTGEKSDAPEVRYQGKLTVSTLAPAAAFEEDAKGPASFPQNISWVYYLEGIPQAETAPTASRRKPRS